MFAKCLCYNISRLANVVNLSAEGGGGQKSSKSCLRSLCMAHNTDFTVYPIMNGDGEFWFVLSYITTSMSAHRYVTI